MDWSLFRIPGFRDFLCGRSFFNLCLQLQAVLLGWRVYELTHDALYLGLMGLAEAIPALSLALWGGSAVDRGQPLKILRLMAGLISLNAFILLLMGAPLLPVSRTVQLASLFGVSFASGALRAFGWPSLFALLPQIVPRERLAIAQTWQSVFFQASAVGGPLLAGALYGWGGSMLAFFAVFLAAVSGWIFSLRLKLPPVERSLPSVRNGFAHEVAAGLRFVFSRQELLGALALDMFAVLFGGVTALLPIFASEVLGSGPESLGLLRAAPALGALLMGGVLVRRSPGRLAGPLLLGSVAGFGVCMIGFALSRSLVLSFSLLALGGAFDQVSVIIRHTILQLATPDEMRGRVSSINMIFIGSSNELGEFESGLAAHLLGLVPSVIFGGCMTLIVVSLAAWRLPRLRRLGFDGGSLI